ncbi:MEMO1 family [Crucibulum laeve]|uniref:MEMO1 family n=1 Tax=Crucibulum laeve TaxID=68775 RepID=A0A5C3M8T7_9AGAR|nr:MEMO1 family [Crucibulum laeve]
MSNIVRNASHAGSWYSDDGSELNNELSAWLDSVNPSGDAYPIKGCKAVIAPHAGYSYSGPTAAWAYKSIDTTEIKRVFILGPSHHYYLAGCALSRCTEYETPIGNLPLDLETIQELRSTGQFESMTLKADEEEHSIEMHLPYIRKVFEGLDIKIVPVLVGAISKEIEAVFGELLSPYLAREDTLCVVSSDFCHWGTRFSYTYYYPEPAPSDAAGYRLSRSSAPSPSYPIYESITRLDHEATNLLTLPPSTAADAHEEFAKYLSRTKNTICGRHPIGVLFGAMAQLERTQGAHPTVKWVKYDQSSHCHRINDSSVSYASAWIRF